MKHIKLFFLFWKNFIFGDMPYVALFILWSMACLRIFTQFNFNIWWFLPVIISVIILAISIQPQKKPTLSLVHHMLIIFIASACVVLLPLGLFRLLSNSIVAESTTAYITYVIYCLVIAILGGFIAKRYLLIGHCAALIASVILIIY